MTLRVCAKPLIKTVNCTSYLTLPCILKTPIIMCYLWTVIQILWLYIFYENLVVVYFSTKYTQFKTWNSVFDLRLKGFPNGQEELLIASSRVGLLLWSPHLLKCSEDEQNQWLRRIFQSNWNLACSHTLKICYVYLLF